MAVTVALGALEMKGTLLSVHASYNGHTTEVIGRVQIGTQIWVVDITQVAFNG